MSTLIILLIILGIYIYYRFFFYSEKNKDFGNAFFLCLGAAYITGAAKFVRLGLYADAILPFIMSFAIQFSVLFSIFYFSRKFFKKNNSTTKLNKINIKKNTKHNADSNVNIESINTKNESTKKVSDQIENISSEEEEEIYAKVSREVDSEDRKEGSWAKALIQSDGDESKAKIAYMKLRVERLTSELIEVKEKELEVKEKELKEKEINQKKIDSLKSKQRHMDVLQKNSAESADAIYVFKEIKINIFKGQSGDGRDNYFWVKKMNRGFLGDDFETPFFDSAQEVKDDIVKYYESLFKDSN